MGRRSRDNDEHSVSGEVTPFDPHQNPLEGNNPYLDEDLMGAFSQPVARASDVSRLSRDNDPELNELNNPDIVTLAEPPLIGGRTTSSDMYGNSAETFGRMSSPKLYSSASQHPGAVQYRVWRMENGIPVGIGVIDSECTEEDFVEKFYPAMPKEGDGKTQFRLRPIDLRGNELGKEFPIVISEHHATLRHMREREKARNEPVSPFGGMGGWGGPPRGDVIVQPSGDGGSVYAEEMGRMFEAAVAAADDRTKQLQETLEEERDRLRQEEVQRSNERVHMAERSSQLTEKMMERVMLSDKARADEALKAQQQHSSLVTTTLTTVFQQQQESARALAERMREQDEQRMTRDRDYFERQRQESEDRRRQDLAEFERKRQLELDQIRLDNERREKELAAKAEREKAELEQRRQELFGERERIRQEAEDRRLREQMEWDRKLQIAKDERDAKEKAAKEERDSKERMEREERERRERMDREERETRDRRERDERDARERAERERWEKDKMEWERRERIRQEELQRETERRKEEMMLQLKQLETQAQRDREHAELMARAAAADRDLMREGLERRERQEREAREEAERIRQRQHDMEIKRLDQQASADREHQERMLQLSRMQNSGGLTGLTDMLGMEAGEVLERIFGGGGGGGSEEGGASSGSLVEGAVKVLGPLLEMAKLAMEKSATAPPTTKVTMGPARRADGLVEVQTSSGPRLITEDQYRDLQAAAAQRSRVTVPTSAPPPNPAQARQSVPVPPLPSPQEEVEAVQPQRPVEVSTPPEAPEMNLSQDLRDALHVNTMERAKAAGLSLRDQKTARMGLRALGKQLAEAEEAEWQSIVTSVIVTNPAILAYIEAVSLYAALVETKSHPELIERVVTLLKSQIPEGTIPYNEIDLKNRNSEPKPNAVVAADNKNASNENVP
jgi:hypothetical protein